MLKRRTVHTYARLLHRREYGDKRQLHRTIEMHQSLRRKLRLHDGLQARRKQRLVHSIRLR